MKHPIAKRRAAAPDLPGFARVLPEIQSLIEVAHQHVVSTTNLTLVWLYWNVGRYLTHCLHKMRVSDYLTQLPSKSVLEDRLKLYSQLLDQEGGAA